MKKAREKLKEIMMKNPDNIIDIMINRKCPSIVGIRSANLCTDDINCKCEDCWEKSIDLLSGDSNE